MMQFVRDSDAVGAILAGAGSRPAEELVTALRKGGYLRKYGRYGKPKQHWFRLSHDDKELLWDSSNGKIRSIPLLSVSKIIQGQTTSVFRREPLPDYEAVSFSLLYSEGKGSAKERSLDLVCRNMQEFETWFLGIQLVIVLNQNLLVQQQQQQQAAVAANGQAAAALRSRSDSGSTTPLRKQPSGPLLPRRSEDKLVDKIQEFKQIAASLQPVKAALGGGTSQRTVSGHLGSQAKREIGDCYIWGSYSDAEACGLDLSDGALQCCGLPTMVANTHALDVIQVAVGARHAALTTRGGEVYTWGAGVGGNMGNGTSAGSNHPQQVTRLAGKGTTAVACGHSYTAAVLTDGTLYSWGTGLGGQLGLGPNVTSAVWPTRILAGLEGVRVSHVSCGPYHAAAIGSDGRLFTWGDGLFGKLGHGDHASAPSPRFVTTLAEHWVISVSCGWWHTAAAAVARARLTGRGVNSSASIDSYVSESSGPSSPTAMRRTASNSGSFLRGNIVGTSPAPPDAAPVSPVSAPAAAGNSRDLPTAGMLASKAADMGGAIFTWGGDFRWQQPWAKDNHQGCLGVGDLSGRLVPTLVKGEDNHVQVACGLNFTVALTNNGEVYQMGSTGAQNNRERDKADWKNALVPVLVRGLLSNHTAERLACGMSHVAVVATQRSKANSSSGQHPVTRLLTWGKNSAGQLGIGAGREDHFMPQPVSAVAGRRILFLTCGGNYTLAVCEHDPRARWSRDSLDEGLPTAPSGSLVISSGPSRLHLSGTTLTPGGSSGGPGAAIDRALAAAGNSGISNAGLSGAQRAAGTGGLTVSASLSSLASSVQSGREGGGGGGSGGGSGTSTLARKSDRGRLETRYSDRGFPVHAGSHGSSGSREQQTPSSSKSLGMLTRSMDHSFGGISGGGLGLAHQQGAGNHVSWAVSPGDGNGSSSRSLLRMGNSSKALGGSFSSGPSMNAGSSGLQLQDLSLQALAHASKRGHHLPLPKSFKKGLKAAMGRSDSNSSNRHAHWNDWQSQNQGMGVTRGPGMVTGGSGTPKELWASAPSGRTSSRQLSYSARSEPDLATVSTTSSMTSAAMSVTPSPSLHSMQEGRVFEGSGEMQAASDDFQRQLRYWQERATNMEQQLSRRNHELESLRRELRFSSTSQGTAASDSAQHYSSLRPVGSTDQRSSGGGAAVGSGDLPNGNSSSGSNLAARRGLQPLAPVVTGASGVRPLIDDGIGSSEAMGQSSLSSSMQTGAEGTNFASATPAGATEPTSGASSASASATAAAAGAAVVASVDSTPLRQQQQQRQDVPVLGSYPLSAISPGPYSGVDSPCESMADAREDWGSPGSDASDGSMRSPLSVGGSPVPTATGAGSAAAAAAGAAGSVSGTGLLRGTSLATWMGGDTGRMSLLRSQAAAAAAAVANGGSAGTSLSGASDLDQQQQSAAGAVSAQQQVQMQKLPCTSTGESSFVFAQVDKLEQQQQQQAQQQQQGQPGLVGLRDVSSFAQESSPFIAAASSSGESQGQQQQRTSQKQQSVQEQQQEQQLLQQQQEMFRGMSEHSKEASRVLALFQESQRHRQQLEQQQQQGVELPPLSPSPNAAADPSSSIAPSKRPSVGAAASAVAAGAAAVVGRADAVGVGSSSAAAAVGGGVGTVDVAAAGAVSALDVDAVATDDTAAPTALSPAAAHELDLLREQNWLLQQQLQELRQQQQGVVAALPAPVTVVAARGSLGPGGSVSGAGLTGALTKHRKTMSVDIGSSPVITQEVSKGVYLSLQALPDGGYELKRVRFAKQVFSSEDAEQWWTANKQRVYAAFNITQQNAPPTWQQQQQQRQQSPELLSQQPMLQQQQQGGDAGSSAGRVLVSLANPHPLGAPPANAPTLGGLRELRVKRSSNGAGDWTSPRTSPNLNSPQGSTLELETLQLPPSTLFDTAFAAAQADSDQQQQQQTLRSWPAITVSPDGPTVSRSSSIGPAGVEGMGVGFVGSRVGAGSSRLSQTAVGDVLCLDPQGASQQQQQQGQFVSIAPSTGAAAAAAVSPASYSVLSSAGSGIESVWQPVLPRKGSLGPGAVGAGVDGSPAGAAAGGASSGGAAGSGGHKRSGSGLFRWLSKAHDAGVSSSNGSV